VIRFAGNLFERIDAELERAKASYERRMAAGSRGGQQNEQ
jgi:hypothetical protein